jgi:hypothetical protein
MIGGNRFLERCRFLELCAYHIIPDSGTGNRAAFEVLWNLLMERVGVNQEEEHGPPNAGAIFFTACNLDAYGSSD